MPFRGEHFHSVDDKGRVIIPLKFRKDLGDSFVMTKGVGGCLFLYPEEDFAEIETILRTRPVLDQNALTLKRFLCAGASDASFDTQGRVAIPQNLREFASIRDDVVIAGTGEKIEIWSLIGWKAFNARLDDAAVMESAAATGLGVKL